MDHAFVTQLTRLAASQPTRAKWVFVPGHGIGRALGDRIVLEGTDWANLRFVTPLDVALRMGAPFLVERGIDPSEEGLGPALVMRLLLGLPEDSGYFRPLADQPQMALALWSTIRELRMAGVRAADLRTAPIEPAGKQAELTALLEGYESFLRSSSRGDRALLFEEALGHPDWCPIQPADVWTMVPDAVWAPLERRLIEMMPGEHLEPAALQVPGTAVPRRLAGERVPRRVETSGSVPAAFFHAGGAEAEVEEVFRRVLGAGVPLDQVEIACASDGYATLIWEKALRFGWAATLSHGVAAPLTRPGRALLGLIEWIEDDFAAGLLRRLLQSGDLTLGKDSPISAGRAARVLVQAQAAWGRDTYRLALGRYASSVRTRASRDDIPSDERARLESRAVEADALATWIARIVERVPQPDEGGRVDLQALVDCAREFVRTSAACTSAQDHAAAARLALSIGELADLGDFRCGITQALRFIRERVEDLSVGADRPRPGHLFVSSLRESGVAGRRHVFVVGLEEGRVFPVSFEDPILLDNERARIDEKLARSSDRLDEAVYAVLHRLASIGATPGVELTLSYSCRDLRQFRETYASWVMLHQFRLAAGDATKSYADLHAHLGAPVSCVPPAAGAALSAGRWWLHGVTRAGEAAGRAAVAGQFPAIAAGARAEAARDSGRFTEFDGFVPDAGAVLDPCADERVVSPTQLEEAASCPFRYFLRRGLGVDAIETGDRDRDLWLNPLIRGSLLHDLYAGLLRRAREQARRPSIEQDQGWLRDQAQEVLDDLRREMPPPSIEIEERESREFIADLDLFLHAEVRTPVDREPVALEVGFGRLRGEDSEPLSISTPVTVRVANLTFRVAGRVDRIDRVAENTFEILDYKTGSYFAPAWKGTFAGGRRLQHALYGLAAVELLKKTCAKPAVAGAQYYFSSNKGGLRRKPIPAQPVSSVGQVLSDLRDVIVSGTFVHTADDRDCRFCDYGAACGANVYGRAKTKLGDSRLAVYQRLRAHE